MYGILRVCKHNQVANYITAMQMQMAGSIQKYSIFFLNSADQNLNLSTAWYIMVK